MYLYEPYTYRRSVPHHKYLGIMFSENGKWNDHINHILQKSSGRIHILRKLNFDLDRLSLQKLYFAFIRPLLEYGDIIWCNIPDILAKSLENINIEAARIVTGATKLTSIERLYEDTGWCTLSSRRQRHRLQTFHKMFHNLRPSRFFIMLSVNLQFQNLPTYQVKKTRT